MALTDDVKKELTATTITRPSARAAEVAAILRFAGQLHNANGQLAYEIELEDQAIADRLTTAIGDLYDIKVSSHVVGPQAPPKIAHPATHWRRRKGTNATLRPSDSLGAPSRGITTAGGLRFGGG